jgi:carotenoid cleavage oxygenase
MASTTTASTTTTNRYLSGNFAPVLQEVTAGSTELGVTGSIPAELNGRYLRNGPNPVLAPDPDSYHWFTGDGMVHGIRLRDGRAQWYRNRWVRSNHVAEALHEDLPPRAVHGGMDFAPNTNVIGHAGRTLAIVEAGALPYELDDELNTIGPFDFGGTLAGGYTAHPKLDPRTGELVAVSYFWGWGNDVEVTVVSPDATVASARRITMGGPVSLHDTAITPNWIVLYDLPVLFDFEMVNQGARFPYRWFPEYHSRIGLLPRNTESTEVIWHDIEPCYVFHTLNAFDDPAGAGLTLDVVRHPSMFATSMLGPAEGTPTLERWSIDGKGGPVRPTRLDDRGQEFPRADERRLGLPYRYGYAVTGAGNNDDPVGTENGLIRHDLETGASVARHFGPSAQVGEGVFVPRHPDAAPTGANETDGWLMALVYEGTTDTSSLYILNADDLGGDPQAVITLPQRVPVGFHGNWVSD